MAKQLPILEVNYYGSNPPPRCSVCKQKFDTDVSALDLISTFILHARKKHAREDVGQTAARIVSEATEGARQTAAASHAQVQALAPMGDAANEQDRARIPV